MKPIFLENALMWVRGSNLRSSKHLALRSTSTYGVAIDSRALRSGNLFVALKGENTDGHRYLDSAQRAQAGAAIVAFDAVQVLNDAPKKLPLILVPDTVIALQELAKGYREQFALLLAVIVGSNGKTTSKEMVHSIFKAHCASLGDERMAHSTVGNFNNEIGLPLTLLRLNEHHRYSVVELGMNHPGETVMLASIAQPTIALINNAQREHQEFMQTVDAVAKEHGAVIEALAADGVAVLPAQDAYIGLWRQLAGARRVVDFSLHSEQDKTPARIYGTRVDVGTHQTISIHSDQGSIEVKLCAAGEHNARNALAAAAVAYAAGIPMASIQAGLNSFSPVKGRMQQHTASLANGTYTLIDDTYNANPDSVAAAIKALDAMAGRTVMVLGDMGEVGEQGEAFHAEAGQLAAASRLAVLYTIGSMSIAAHHAFSSSGKAGQHFDSVDALVAHLKQTVSVHDTVLVKASRFMRLEHVVEALQAPSVTTNQDMEEA